MSSVAPQFEHDRYEELCALSTAGVLTHAESEALRAHLDTCAACNRTLTQFQSLAHEAMPLLADARTQNSDAASLHEADALERLLARVQPIVGAEKGAASPSLARIAAWRGPVAAALVAGIALASYHVGRRQRIDAAAPPSAGIVVDAKEKLSHESLETALATARDRDAALEAVVAEKSAELKHLAADELKVEQHDQKTQEQLAEANTSYTASNLNMNEKLAALTTERDSSNARRNEIEQLYHDAQIELASLHSQRQQNLMRIASLEGQVGSLNVAMNSQSSRLDNDEQYLASDKDIRDLIGARNLYIADIMDVDENGSSRRPFGRVFYTKTKSLVFYAYDLDQQPGVKQASVFRVWGRTGPNDRKPLNLGVLYMDSETNRRWTLRVNNPEQLAQLESVFVTIEPRQLSDRPTGKPFLFASLRREPNHP
ncbi:hypothetical protein [Silvibacterium acidisoli]|uniref:hypothetical protein n=1 Tax=Acidobacteriaceae bacterium ZG23-2 TaxID=2883246 RepID=UPI00406C1035